MMTTSERRACLERGLALARAGRAAEMRRDLDVAVRHYGEARGAIESVGATPLLASILRWEGSAQRDLGRLPEADDLYRESFRAAVECDSLGAQAAAVNCRGVVQQRRGRLDQAERIYEDALILATEAGELRLIGMIRQNLGVVFNIRGDFELALSSHRSALYAFEAMRDDEGITWVLNNLGMLFTDLGEPDRAEQTFLRGLRLATSRGDRPLRGILLCNYAESLISTKRWEDASRSLDTALDIACEGEDVSRAGEALKLRGVLERECGNLDSASERLGQALACARSVRNGLLEAEVLRERGELHLLRLDAEAAAADLAAAETAFRSAGAIRDAEEARKTLAGLAEPKPASTSADRSASASARRPHRLQGGHDQVHPERG